MILLIAANSINLLLQISLNSIKQICQMSSNGYLERTTFNFPEILISPVNTHHWEALQNIGRTTFQETFQHSNTASDFQTYIDKSFSEHQILSELKNPNSTFFFAMIQDEIVGYLKLNVRDAQKEQIGSDAIEIERIYVLQKYHGLRVGDALMEKALSEARRFNMKCVWLGVWEYNTRAIEFYKRKGFIAFDTHIFILGSDHQTDILMKLEL